MHLTNAIEAFREGKARRTPTPRKRRCWEWYQSRETFPRSDCVSSSTRALVHIRPAAFVSLLTGNGKVHRWANITWRKSCPSFAPRFLYPPAKWRLRLHSSIYWKASQSSMCHESPLSLATGLPSGNRFREFLMSSFPCSSLKLRLTMLLVTTEMLQESIHFFSYGVSHP